MITLALKFMSTAIAMLILTGCLVSEYELFPFRSGTLTPLQTGTYQVACKDEKTYTVTLTEKRTPDGTWYRYEEPGNESLALSFHHVVDNRYVLAARNETSQSRAQALLIIGLDPYAVTFLKYDVEQVSDFAELNDVSIRQKQFGTEELLGSAADQKNFLLALASENAPLAITCSLERKEVL